MTDMPVTQRALGVVRPALRAVLEAALEGRRLTDEQARRLADVRGAEHPALWATAAAIRDRGRPPVVTYSRKVFIPLTNLCRDICSYCTFARLDTDARAHTMSPDEILAIARAGQARGCKEALFTLGDRPEARFESHRIALRRFGHESTHSYLVAMCRMVLEETGLLPHPNAGILGRRELAELREVSASQGMMLESVSERLCEPGGPHHLAPDKRPATRLAMLRRAGELRIPFTSGILIGIGETLDERVDALLALRDLHERHGHIQEVIVQNFRAKPDTPMAGAGEPGLIELMSACATARLVMGPDMSVQAPPNLSADYGPLLLSGINDWGGVSPLTPDFVNPEAPWPELGQLARLCSDAGYTLRERLTVYPEYLADDDFIAPGVREHVRAMADENGLARDQTPVGAGAPA
ncbi:7,8-didemethyl-8-hydroxy-5-deazariboflavin synthase CofG [Mycolicibacterium sp.]|uniref:7,8-didemethyl-8-hydroxy-5-deazariboflavin synthase CofG n=1 Tax=Mycolicibacterium sp. TaxID=2320850 RepID=UPI0037C90BD5